MVCDIFFNKLTKYLNLFKLPFSYISILVLASLDKNFERKSRAKQSYKQLLKLFNYRQTDRFPAYFLPYAISLLAHNLNFESLKENEDYLKKLVFFFNF
jgi:hypothetical protein